jgi:ABC-type transporter Mla MlaB component
MRKKSTADAPAPDEAAPAGPSLRLPAQLGIEQVAELKGQLGQLLTEPKPIVVDAADVERIHGAALQLFCLFCRDRRAAGRDVEFARPSTTLRSAAALLGASTLLQIARNAQ